MFDDQDRVRVRNRVLAVTALAWVLLWSQPVWHPGLSHAHHHAASQGVISVSGAMEWMLMLAAMMAPILISPIQFVRGHALARRRTRSTLLFVTGYTAIWMSAGVLILLLVRALDSSRFPTYVTLGTIFSIALIWQCSPAKQVCLNRCHRLRALAAFGRAADTDALVFGASQGVWCAASCWAWMLLPMLLSSGHAWAMIAAAILIFCERLEEPGPARWRWRGLGRTGRIVAARVKFCMRGNVAQTA